MSFISSRKGARVTRPGGRIVMGNWIPNDPTYVAQLLKISSAYAPPPPEGFVSPMTWGVESTVQERFTGAGIPKANIACTTDTYLFKCPGSPAQFVDVFRHFYGPTMNAYAAAEASGRTEDLQRELVALFEGHNQSGHKDRTLLAATFMRVTVTV